MTAVHCTSAGCPNPPTNPGRFWEEGQWWPVSYCDSCVELVKDHFAPDPPRPPNRDSDDALLADLFRRALKAEILDTRMIFLPSYQILLCPGLGYDSPITLTDPEIDALRRSV